MITSFEIENFRCFHSTKGKGFSRINLFGGRNNVGQSSLLEALLLMCRPSIQSINTLLAYRRIDANFIKEMPQSAWDNFFYDNDKSKNIELKVSFDLKSNHKIVISCDEFVEELLDIVNENKNNTSESVIAFANTLSNKEALRSALHINIFDNNSEKPIASNVFVASSGGALGKGAALSLSEAHLIPSNVKSNNSTLASEFGKAKYIGHSDLLLKAFKIVEPSIEMVDALLMGEAGLYLKRKDETYMSISLFGDAMNKIADFVLKIINNRNGILLIDEIENGIHYENHENVWKFLFDLCIEFNVQIFATSHSGEMIEAFKNVIIDNGFEKEGSYFEMLRHPSSDEIIISRIPISVLDDRIENKEPIRGEKSNARKKAKP
jgi:AAA15 family ATPase/GTPase